jgi:hypothetical protein
VLLFHGKREMRMAATKAVPGRACCFPKFGTPTLTLIVFVSVLEHAVKATHWIGHVQLPRATAVKRAKGLMDK